MRRGHVSTRRHAPGLLNPDRIGNGAARRRVADHVGARGYSSTRHAVTAARLLLRAETGNAPLGPGGGTQPLAAPESPASTERLVCR